MHLSISNPPGRCTLSTQTSAQHDISVTPGAPESHDPLTNVAITCHPSLLLTPPEPPAHAAGPTVQLPPLSPLMHLTKGHPASCAALLCMANPRMLRVQVSTDLCALTPVPVSWADHTQHEVHLTDHAATFFTPVHQLCHHTDGTYCVSK
jgi:hypothetical protein